MTVKKFRLWLAPNIPAEEEWLTSMSKQGLQLKKYSFFMYHFEEDPTKSYTYQIDFRQGPKKDYFQLYEDAGWEYVTESLGTFHYFRTNASKSKAQKIYSDDQSIQDSYTRMRGFYLLIFVLFLVSQIGLVATWKGAWPQYMVVGIDIVVIIVYLYLFIVINKRINFYRRR